MKNILLICLGIFVVGCSTTPMIIPDTTTDNVVLMQIKDNINHPGPTPVSYGWLFWYVPVAILVLLWGYRELIRKPIPKTCIDKKTGDTVIEEKEVVKGVTGNPTKTF
jgi:hypothetical protein